MQGGGTAEIHGESTPRKNHVFLWKLHPARLSPCPNTLLSRFPASTLVLPLNMRWDMGSPTEGPRVAHGDSTDPLHKQKSDIPALHCPPFPT